MELSSDTNEKYAQISPDSSAEKPNVNVKHNIPMLMSSHSL